MKQLGLVFITIVLFYYASVEGIWPHYLCEIDIKYATDLYSNIFMPVYSQTSRSFEYLMFVQQAPAAICQVSSSNKENIMSFMSSSFNAMRNITRTINYGPFMGCGQFLIDGIHYFLMHVYRPSNPLDRYPEYCGPRPFNISSLSVGANLTYVFVRFGVYDYIPYTVNIIGYGKILARTYQRFY